MKLSTKITVALFLTYVGIGTPSAQQPVANDGSVPKVNKFEGASVKKGGAVAKPKKLRKLPDGNGGAEVGGSEADPPPDQQDEEGPGGWIDCGEGTHSVTIEVCDEDGTNCVESTDCVPDQ